MERGRTDIGDVRAWWIETATMENKPTNLSEGDVERSGNAAAGPIPFRADIEDLVSPLEHQDLVGGTEEGNGTGNSVIGLGCLQLSLRRGNNASYKSL